MRLIHGTLIGAWIVIGINLLMAFGAIGVFARMAPAITIILEQNGRSLQASEDMLVALALSEGGQSDRHALQTRFEEALHVATGNITEVDEPMMLEEIEQSYRDAFAGDAPAIERVVGAIVALAETNRAAMVRADERAEQLGRAGGWSVAIMAAIAFAVTLILLRNLNLKLIVPLREIHEVVNAYHAGDKLRRCSIASATREVKVICNGINSILDRDSESYDGLYRLQETTHGGH